MNKRQVPFLYPRPCADGSTSWHWKPSPRLAKLGWTSRKLGKDQRKAIEAALAINAQLAEWEAARITGPAPAQGTAKPAHKWTFGDLAAAYQASPAFTADIAACTRREYKSRLGQLTFWADDGKLLLRAIDPQMVQDLKTALLAPQNGQPASKFKVAGMLRVLRLVLRWGKAQGLLAADPTEGVAIPTPPSRTARLDWRSIDHAAALTASPIAARYLRLGFWTMQRREDMVSLNRFAWREFHGIDPRDKPALVNDKGEVWGFRLQQHKTGRWVDCPIPPFLHADIEAAFQASEWLFPHSQDPLRAMSGDVIRRLVKPALDAAGFPHIQLRDLRRSGMSGIKDWGALKSDVFAISGHPLDGQQRTMADVYMPPDTMAAGRAIAAAERTRRQLEAREAEQEGQG